MFSNSDYDRFLFADEQILEIQVDVRFICGEFPRPHFIFT